MFRKSSSIASLASCGLLVFLTFTLLAGCQTTRRYWPAQTGQVLDAETGKPIQNAIVLANWQGVVSYSNTRCFHQVRDITDEQGRFHISAWENQTSTAKSSYQNIHIYTHKYGYRRSEKTYRTKSYRKNIYYLERHKTNAIERLKYLSHYISIIGCGPHSGSKERLFPVLKSIYREVLDIATTDDVGEQELVRQIQDSISLYWRDKEPLWTPAQFDKYFEEHVKGELLR